MPNPIVDYSTGEIVDPAEFQALDYNPALIAQAVFERSHERKREEAEALEQEELDDIGRAPHGYIVVKQACGGRRVVPIVCSDHTCIPCERRRSIMVRRRWWPLFNRMKSPKFITLTIRDGICLSERIDVFHESFRKLFKMRLGRNNLIKLRAESLSFLRDHLRHQVREGKKTKDGIVNVSVQDAIASYTSQKRSIDRFIDKIQRRHAKTGKWPEMRHEIGPGFASLEVTDNGDWHVHRHLCVDTQFIPWAFLCAAWIYATRGEGSVTYIENVEKSYKSLKELIKYMTKGWEIGADDEIEDADSEHITREDKLAELRQALRGKKQIWPLGKAKPEKEHSVCPYCQDPDCKANREGQAELLEHGEINGTQFRLFQFSSSSFTECKQFIMLREADGRWREAPLIYTSRVCVAPEHPKGVGWDDLMAIKAKRQAKAAQN